MVARFLALAFALIVVTACTHEAAQVESEGERSTSRPSSNQGPTSRNPTDGSKKVISESGYDITPLSDEVKQELTKDLTPLEYQVTCQQGTERPHTGDLLDNKKLGTYICRVCGLPLFEARTKFKSGTGWPSFYSPFDKDHVKDLRDSSHGMIRVENRCARCDAHLGHVFTDGPQPTGLRYCINSVSLDFVAEGEEMPERSRPAK